MVIITETGAVINGKHYSESDIERGYDIERTIKEQNQFDGMTIDEIYHFESEKNYLNNQSGEII